VEDYHWELSDGLLLVCRDLRIAFVAFDDTDVVRHPLVQRIVKAYDRYDEMIGAGRQYALKLRGASGQDQGQGGEHIREDEA